MNILILILILNLILIFFQFLQDSVQKENFIISKQILAFNVLYEHIIYKKIQTNVNNVPKNVKCSGGFDLSLDPGFWRPSNLSNNIYSCDQITNQCIGGFNPEN